MRNIVVFIISVAILILSGCSEGDIEAERANVQLVLDQIIQANETEDMELIAKVTAHDDDIVIFGTSTADYHVGWDSFKESMERQFELFERTDISVRGQSIKVHRSGNVAWFSQVLDFDFSAHGQRFRFEGVRVTGVLEKRNSDWVAVQIHMSIPTT